MNKLDIFLCAVLLALLGLFAWAVCEMRRGNKAMERLRVLPKSEYTTPADDAS